MARPSLRICLLLGVLVAVALQALKLAKPPANHHDKNNPSTLSPVSFVQQDGAVLGKTLREMDPETKAAVLNMKKRLPGLWEPTWVPDSPKNAIEAFICDENGVEIPGKKGAVSLLILDKIREELGPRVFDRLEEPFNEANLAHIAAIVMAVRDAKELFSITWKPTWAPDSPERALEALVRDENGVEIPGWKADVVIGSFESVLDNPFPSADDKKEIRELVSRIKKNRTGLMAHKMFDLMVKNFNDQKGLETLGLPPTPHSPREAESSPRDEA